jgi:thiol-disulfide isomerase/thioredoxin
VGAEREAAGGARAGRSRRAWLQAVAGTALVAGAGWEMPLHVRAQPAAASQAVPLSWPALTLLDGTVLRAADWQDTGAIVVFWATYCGFCRRHNVHLDRLHRSLQGQPVRVLGVALDTDAALVRRYLRQHGFDFPVTLDAARLRPLLTPRRIIPNTCVVDRSGRLVRCIPGEMAEDDVLELGGVALRSA